MPSRSREIASGLWRFWGYLPQILTVYRRSDRAHFILSVGLVVYDGLATSISIWFTKLLIDEGESLWVARQTNDQIDYTTLGVLIVGQVVVWIIASTSEILWRPMTEILGVKANHVARQDLSEKASRIPYLYYEDGEFYDKIEAAQKAQEWPGYTSLFLFSMIASSVRLASVAGLLSIFSGWISLLIVVGTIPFLLAQVRYIVDGHQLFRFQSLERRRLDYHAKVLVDRAYAKEVRIFGFAQHWLANYKAIWERCYRESRDLFLARNKVVLIADIPGIALAAGIYGFIILRASQGSISLGDLAMGLAATLQFRSATKAVANGIAQVFHCSLRVFDYFEFMNLPEAGKEETTQRSRARRDSWVRVEAAREPIISFRNVSFEYPGGRGYALNDVTFDIWDSETIALVGKNGAGKTTLAKLLCGLLDPKKGTILFRGREVGTDAQNSLLSATSAVFQDFAKYELTVEDNIRLGDVYRDATDGTIDKVARQTRLLSVLKGLPDGMQTQLGRSANGTDLSVGQWQHIALARCLYKASAEVLILDEPTAAMDPEAEYELYKLLVDISGSQTSILVSHRLSTVRAASRVLVLDKGCLCEEGSHEELIQNQGIYAQFFRMQADRYRQS